MKTSYIVISLLFITVLLNLIFFWDSIYQLDNTFINTIIILLVTSVGFLILQGVMRRHSQKKSKKGLKLKTR